MRRSTTTIAPTRLPVQSARSRTASAMPIKYRCGSGRAIGDPSAVMGRVGFGTSARTSGRYENLGPLSRDAERNGPDRRTFTRWCTRCTPIDVEQTRDAVPGYVLERGVHAQRVGTRCPLGCGPEHPDAVAVGQ